MYDSTNEIPDSREIRINSVEDDNNQQEEMVNDGIDTVETDEPAQKQTQQDDNTSARVEVNVNIGQKSQTTNQPRQNNQQRGNNVGGGQVRNNNNSFQINNQNRNNQPRQNNQQRGNGQQNQQNRQPQTPQNNNQQNRRTRITYVQGAPIYNVNAEIENESPQVNYMGLRETGAVFTFSSEELAKYFKEYFEHWGIHNIIFGDGNYISNGLPEMYFIFPKTKELVATGRTPDDVVVDILGGKIRGQHIRLNEKLLKLVAPFVEKNRPVVRESDQRGSQGEPYCFIKLDPTNVFWVLFNHNRRYNVAVLDTCPEGSSGNILYRILRQKTGDTGKFDVNHIIKRITRG